MGLEIPVEEIEGDHEIVTEARAVLAEGARRIADEVRNSLDYQSMRAGSEKAESAILTGAAMAIPGFCQEVGSALGVPFEIGAVAEANPGGFSGIEPGKLAVAAGLTLEEAQT